MCLKSSATDSITDLPGTTAKLRLKKHFQQQPLEPGQLQVEAIPCSRITTNQEQVDHLPIKSLTHPPAASRVQLQQIYEATIAEGNLLSHFLLIAL